MSKELVISANRHETRVAVLEDDQVVEVFYQRENEYSLAGSIHKGRVTRVLPGMQSAFVDIGLGRDAFLYVSDFFEDNEEYDKIVTSVEDKVLKLDRTPIAPASAAGAAEAAPQSAAVPPQAAEGAEAPATAAAAPATLSPPASAMQGPAGFPGRRDQRGDRGEPGGDRRDQGGDRRGRRSRRGRGQRGGRGLPETKYYTPRPESDSRHQAPPAAVIPEALPDIAAESHPRVVFDPTHDDFFVLPGESLAKYTGRAEDEDEAPAVVEVGEPIDADESLEGATQRMLEEAAARLEPEPASVETTHVEPAAVEAHVEPVAEDEPVKAALFEEPPADLPETEPAPIQMVALETGFVAVESEAPEPVECEAELADAEGEAEEVVEIEEEAEAESGSAEPLLMESEMTEGSEGEPGETVAEAEGPEPARMPTSLTATLREQGGRYPHRVSRRTRRKGRGDRGGGPEGQRGPQGEARPMEQSEQRTVQRPDGRPDGRPEGRQEGREGRESRSESRADKIPLPSISDLLREGQEIIVQIAKEPLGQKGARITSHIALPGRFLVYMPTVDHIGVSRKIPSDEERLRLKRILQSNRAGISGGYIVRTAGEGRSEEELRADMMFLYNLWLDMRQKAERRPAPVLIHHDLNVVERILRDQLTASYKSVWVDNEEAYESVLRFVQRFQPALVNRVKMYTRANPIFDEFGITAELEKALRPKVWLKSGGYIVINQTEALVAIDINTGKYVGKSNRLEDTIVKTNTDAIKEIVRQIRLRDLGGIIVVDFIDMDERKNRQKVMQALEEGMRADRAPYKILQFNDFGLVAITRKRVKQSLERTLCTPCTYCEGAGYVKSPQTVVSEILVEAQKIARAVDTKDVMLRVSPEVAKLLKSNQNTYLQEIEETLSKPVIVKSDPLLHQEKFDLA
jgi:ribonuclease G